MSCEQETLRVLLQNQFDRLENLVQINHQSTIAVPSVLAAIWGIEGGLDNFQNVWILGIISIILLLIWRYHAHYIDNAIAGNYYRILQLEKKLEVPIEYSIYPSLIREITDKEEPFTSSVLDTKKLIIIDILWKEKKLGYRGHDTWDNVAYVLIFLFSVFGLFSILSSGLAPIHMMHPFFGIILFIKLIFLGVAIGFGFVITIILILIFRCITPIQKDPEPGELQRIWDKIPLE